MRRVPEPRSVLNRPQSLSVATRLPRPCVPMALLPVVALALGACTPETPSSKAPATDTGAASAATEVPTLTPDIARDPASAGAPVSDTAPAPLAFAALAANCYTCHVGGQAAQGIPGLAALDAEGIADALYRYRDVSPTSPAMANVGPSEFGDTNTVMHRIARALTDAQIAGIAEFVAAWPDAGLGDASEASAASAALSDAPATTREAGAP